MLLVSTIINLRRLTGSQWKKVQGVWMPLNYEIGFNTVRWILNNRYEEAELEIVKRYICQDDKVFEIGTGLGFICTYCSKCIGSDRVHTFEANPENVQLASSVFKKNDVNPSLCFANLGEKDGFSYFPVNKNSRLASSVFKEGYSLIEVPSMNLNRLISEIKPTFLILDIEGSEYDIFRLIDFQTIKKIQVELHPDLLGKARMYEIFSILKKSKFEVEFRHPDNRNYFFHRK